MWCQPMNNSMKNVIAVLVVTIVFKSIAATSIPTTRSTYKFVDTSGVDVSGDVFPIREARGDGTHFVLVGEDVSCIAEAACERYAWLYATNTPIANLRQPAPERFLATNLLLAASEFFDNCTNNIKGRLELASTDPMRRFIDLEWDSGQTDLVGADMNFSNDHKYEDNSTTWAWAYGCLNEYLNPTTPTIQTRFGETLSTDNLERMYKISQQLKRLFLGMVNFYDNDMGGWDTHEAGVIKGNGYTYHRYSYSSTPTVSTETVNEGWDFSRGCWVRSGNEGRVSEYGWAESDSAPVVILRPEYTGKVDSAYLYLAIRGDQITSWNPNSKATGRVLLGCLPVPLTYGGTTTLLGQTCDVWNMPDAMKSSKDILGDFIFNIWGDTSTIAGGYPCIWNCYLYCGLLEAVMKPNVDIDKNDWPSD